MTLTIIINAFLCLAMLIAIVGSHAWAIACAHHELLGIRTRMPEAATLAPSDVWYEGRAVIQP